MKVIYKEGTNLQSQTYRNSEIIEGAIKVTKGVTYIVKAEVLRNDLSEKDEWVRSVKLDGNELFQNGCNPPGNDHDCDFFECPAIKDFVITSTTGTIGVKMDFIEHSHDCDCDVDTWSCSPQFSVTGRAPVEAVMRFTLTPVGGEILVLV